MAGEKKWEQDKRWSDRFLPEIKQILGLHLIGEPPQEEDAERNTDLIVLRMEAVRIGCRVRKNQYVAKYGDEFTIRSGRPSGAKTELSKILEGYGDYLLYGFSNEEESHLSLWTLADLRVFRLEYNRQLYRLPAHSAPGRERSNGDSSSKFCVFRWADFPASIKVAETVRY